MERRLITLFLTCNKEEFEAWLSSEYPKIQIYNHSLEFSRYHFRPNGGWMELGVIIEKGRRKFIFSVEGGPSVYEELFFGTLREKLEEKQGKNLDLIDPTDQRILKILRDEPGITDSTLAQRLGVTRQTANRRKRALQKAGLITVNTSVKTN